MFPTNLSTESYGEVQDLKWLKFTECNVYAVRIVTALAVHSVVKWFVGVCFMTGQ